MKKAIILTTALSFLAVACSSSSSPTSTADGENHLNDTDNVTSDTETIEPDGDVAVDTDITPENDVPGDEDEIFIDNDEVAPSDTDTTPAKDFTGTYAEKVTISTLDKLPGVGDVETTSSYYGINTIEFVGGEYVSTSISCKSVSVAKNAAFQTIIPDIVVQCIPPLVGKLTVTDEDGTIKIDKEETVMPVGVKLADPWNDPLPTDPSDSRIWDQDGDGKPGVTIEVKASGMTGKIYTIRKERGLWSASMDLEGNFYGLFTDKSEQKTIGADPALFNINPESKVNPDLSKSNITLTKLDGEYDCTKLIAEFDSIFGEGK